MDHKDGSPKISVIVPTFQRPVFLERALGSILMQSVRPYEIIVVDDGCSLSLNRESLGDFSDITVLRTRGRVGPSKARNIGAGEARGEWLLFLDDDDQLHKDYVRNLILYVKKRLGACLFFTGVVILNSVDNGLAVRKKAVFDSYRSVNYLIKDFLSLGLGHGVCVRKSVFWDAGGFDPAYDVAEDTEFFFRLIGHGFIPTPISGAWVIKHEEHDFRLSSSFREYANLA